MSKKNVALLTTMDLPVSVVRSKGENASEGGAPLVPSLEAPAELQHAYEWFNDKLWDGALPPCMIIYTRKKNVLGHFSPDRFQRFDGDAVAELALNPSYLAVRNDHESLSTLVHEMTHVWRHYLGPVNREGRRVTNGYHDRKWAAEMLRIGLIPSDTGAPGGKMTGYRMTQFIETGGAFDRAYAALAESGFRINWADRIVRPNLSSQAGKDIEDEPVKKDRIKFSCQSCGQNAWAKPSATISCTPCRAPMKPA